MSTAVFIQRDSNEYNRVQSNFKLAMGISDPVADFYGDHPTHAISQSFAEREMTPEFTLPYRVTVMWRTCRFVAEAFGWLGRVQQLLECPKHLTSHGARSLHDSVDTSAPPKTAVHASFRDEILHRPEAYDIDPEEVFCMDPRGLSPAAVRNHRKVMELAARMRGSLYMVSCAKHLPGDPPPVPTPVGRWGSIGLVLRAHESYTDEDCDRIYMQLHPELYDLALYEYEAIKCASDMLMEKGNYAAIRHLMDTCSLAQDEASVLVEISGQMFAASAIPDTETARAVLVAQAQRIREMAIEAGDRRVALAALNSEGAFLQITRHEKQDSGIKDLDEALTRLGKRSGLSQDNLIVGSDGYEGPEALDISIGGEHTGRGE